jgi:aspartate aminotransferase-like enzyme
LTALVHRYGAAILVDSVTGLGGVPVETDAWQLDFVLTGSQKALALPPGLAFGVASEAFIARAAQGTSRGLYFDLVEFEQYIHKNQTPNTPAISLLYAAVAQGEYIARETMDARWQRHADMAARTHAWVRQLANDTAQAFDIIAAEGQRSHTVTAVSLPATLTGDAIVKAVAQRGFVIGGGYGQLKQRTFRIGHMGDHTVEGLSRCLEAAADAIRTLLATTPGVTP